VDSLRPVRAVMPRILRHSIRLACAPMLLLGISGCGGDDDGAGPSLVRVATVEITPASDTLQIQATTQLTATLRNSAGTVLAGHYRTWSVTDPALATVALNGVVRALAPGVVSVIATSEGKSDTATITLVPILTLSPGLPSLFVGDTLQLGATLTDVLGGAVPGSVTWTARDPGRAGVANGLVTGINSGFATVVASSAGAAESVEVAVLSPRIGVNREIGYLRWAGGSNSLFTLLPGDTGGKPVSSPASEVSDYSWSPDGARVAVVYYGAPGMNGLFLLNHDGSGEQPLNPEVGYGVRWSPDGTQLAYFILSPSLASSRVQVLATSGGGLFSLLGTPYAQSPEWSPDGRQIAFTRGQGSCTEMWVAEADGSRQKRIPVPLWPCALRWSPDGKLIALTGSIPGKGGQGVWAVNPDGTGFRSVSPNCSESQCTGGDFYGTGWSPDGTKFVMSDALNIYVWSRATGGVDTVGSGDYGVWSPDGLRLAYIDHSDPSGCLVGVGLVGLMNAAPV
jgi:dipeptidyl aminopeptidase/acylaminoacyl peptidase